MSAPPTESDYARVLRMMGASTSKGKEPERLEEVMVTDTARVDDSIRPTKESEVLPIPSEDMTLGELADLMTKYKTVIEHGCYLALFTDLKATPVSSTDPEIEGRTMMGVEEEKLYDWFKAYGKLDEFDWADSRTRGETPPGKMHRFNQELLALRIMYRDNSLVGENLYWIRKERPTHFKVVVAFTKIIRAANNIQQGVTKGSGYDYKEYQTANKLIASAGGIVNNFMADVHKLLQPIEDSKQYLMARRYEMAKKCGIEMDRVGGAVRDARELGRALPGKVTAPEEKPKGVKRLRDDVETMENLRKLGITKKMRPVDFPDVDELRMKGAPDVENYDMRVRDYRPSSPEPEIGARSVPVGLAMNANAIMKAVENNMRSDELAGVLSRLAVTTEDDKLIAGARIRANTSGKKSIAVPRGLSPIGSVVISLINRALSFKPELEKDIAKMVKDGRVANWLAENGGFMAATEGWTKPTGQAAPMDL